ncbi:MAG TPA: biotin-dependent carboxyltransferase family protein [Pyrinomonadaceae bacterium]|nr:biotin-dependent carboxyltransferase family protein [Pyrinomonadaceae bacterium]
MSILINKSGILTTIQDLGRNGFRKYGINPNGAMDRAAVCLINILLGNDEAEAVLEIHFPAPEIVFETVANFALGGGNFAADLDGVAIDNWRTNFADSGSVLTFRNKISGNRAYLSIKGGFNLPEIFGSLSTNLTAGFGGIEGRKLQNGDRIELKSKVQSPKPKVQIANSLLPFYSRFPTVRVVVGAEFDDLTALSEQNFLKTDFVITQNSDRMGFRLIGEPLHLLDSKEFVSSAVNFGTIQLLPDGQMIILMADHQTSGGYPRIASVIPNDLPLVAQLSANDKIAFHLVSIDEAEDLAFEFERDLRFFNVGVKCRKGC